MQTELPQFRNDLHSQLILREGTRLIEVTCPVSGTSFEFFETEYAVACAMDGQKDVDGLAAWSQAQLGFSPKTDELEAIVSKLTDLGYLSGSVPAVQASGADVADAPVDFELGASGPQADNATVAQPTDSDVALGSAGGTAPSNSEELPVAAAVSLGVAGAAGALSQKSSSVDDVALGSAGDASGASNASSPSSKASDGAETASASGVMSADDMPAAQNQDLSVNLEGHLDFSKGDAASKSAAANLSASSAANDSENLTPIEKAQLAETAPVPPADDRDVDSIAARMDTDARALSEPLGSSGLSSADDVGRPVSARSAPRESVNAGAPVVLASPSNEALQAKPLEVPAVTGGTALKEKPVRRPLWAIAIISILAVAGAAYYWFFHHLPSLATTDNLDPSVERAAVVKARSMAASIRPVALSTVPAAPPSDAIQATRTDSIEWMVAAGTEVAEGDVLVRFKGYEEARLEQVELRAEVEKISESLEAGVSRKALVSTKKKLEKAERTLTENATSLKELAVTAPKAGAVEPLVELAESGETEVQAGQDIIRLASASGLIVSFDLGTEPVGYEENSIGHIAPTADPDMKVSCKYAGASDTKVNFACPLDSGLSAGTEVGLYRTK